MRLAVRMNAYIQAVAAVATSVSQAKIAAVNAHIAETDRQIAELDEQQRCLDAFRTMGTSGIVH